jgi:hypothetical protein
MTVIVIESRLPPVVIGTFGLSHCASGGRDLAFQPVTFRYKQELDPDGMPQFGLVAEQVEKVNPDLVVRVTRLDASFVVGLILKDKVPASRRSAQ